VFGSKSSFFGQVCSSSSTQNPRSVDYEYITTIETVETTSKLDTAAKASDVIFPRRVRFKTWLANKRRRYSVTRSLIQTTIETLETNILYEKKIAIATTYTHIIIKCSLYHYMCSVSYRKKAFTTKACPYIILLLCTAL